MIVWARLLFSRSFERPQGRASVHRTGVVGIGEPSPTRIFCEIDRRKIEAKKQGVYHLALLAGFVDLTF
jgi:hypothetical protein